jgi:hypothetical protein
MSQVSVAILVEIMTNHAHQQSHHFQLIQSFELESHFLSIYLAIVGSNDESRQLVQKL